MRSKLLRSTNLNRITRCLILLFVIWNAIDVIYVRLALTRYSADTAEQLGKEKIFIASIHWNNEAILKSHWVPAVVELAKEIGRDNVFVSVQESGSWDDSKGALAVLDEELNNAGIRRKIILDNTTHEDEINKPPAETGWIWTPRKQMELRRIPYLARLRNLVLDPLHELKRSGETFHKVLFLNDVVFTNRDVRNLISTRDGDYAAACSFDTSNPPLLYDTFALRDTEGHGPLSIVWPFFRARKSRRAMKGNQPVPVTSCWNGMVVMDALPFYENELAFRGTPDNLATKHIEGSECCLIHTDNPISRNKGVWLNPRVRVGYSGPAYDGANPEGGAWLSSFQILRGSWMNRLRRWFTSPWFENRTVDSRLSAWKTEDTANEESGVVCLINEMQVLIATGWKHL